MIFKLIFHSQNQLNPYNKIFLIENGKLREQVLFLLVMLLTDPIFVGYLNDFVKIHYKKSIFFMNDQSFKYLPTGSFTTK
jgi:hypothetical protein